MNLLRLTKNLLIFPLLFAVYCFIFSTTTFAQIPEPYVNCASTDSPEWHSLRPYQASPCKLPIDPDSAMSQLCGKDLIARDTFVVTPSDAQRCVVHSCPGTATCYFKYDREFWVTINPFESSYPIAGNTELIPEDEGNEPSGGVEELRLSYWKNHLPPKTEDYDEFEDYWIAYQEWRGKTCKETPVIPLINKSLTICFDNPASPNFWAQLFPNVPYSSTEDREGKLVSTDIMFMRGDFSVEDLQTNWEKDRDKRDENTENNESVLYFPHMEENVELSQILQSTYLTPEILNSEQPVTTPEPEPEYTNKERCVIANTRYNPGDQLFGEIIVGKVTYKAIFECDFPVYPPPICAPYGTCTVSGIFYSDLTTYVPLLDELWSKTVAGNASVVKKIYPKIEADSPIEKIEEIPAVSDVVYEAVAKGSNAKTTIETQNPEIYFPHLGSIYDYFLKGIQTALRPQDYPGVSAGLTDDTPITQVDRLNEYISWYLNGTIYRAEQDPLSADDEVDISRLINFSGPINKLLPQSVQWQKKEEQIEKAGKTNGRHDQIAACVLGQSIPLLGITGFPVACGENQEASVGEASTGASPSPGTGTCPSVPDSAISQVYIDLRDHFFWFVDMWFGAADPCYGQNLARECYNYVVSESKKAGVNPALSLSIWAHESAASNYCKNPSVEDFGVHYIPGKDVVGQLSEWLSIAKGTGWLSCYSSGGWTEPMHTFLSRYQVGESICDPNNTEGNAFYQNMINTWSVVNEPKGGCLDSGGGFVIDRPTNNNCPQ